MWINDLAQVARGIGLVSQQLAKSQAPELREHSQNLARHASELMNLVPRAMNTSNTMPQQNDDSVSSARIDVDSIETMLNTPPPPPAATAQSSTSTDSNAVNSLSADEKAAQAIDQIHRINESMKLEQRARLAMEERKKQQEKLLMEQEQYEEQKRVEMEKEVSRQAEKEEIPIPAREWTEKHVPSSPIARVLGFGSLAVRLALGTASTAVKNISKGEKAAPYQALITDSNAEKLAETLCTMRGAALKLGQMLSIQDESIIPPQLAAALDRVRQGAHIMPKAQLHAQLEAELGENWMDNFKEFDYIPLAAASIGQVHRGVLKDGSLVAMKIQYPGVAESIESDLLNLKRLVTFTNLLPAGLYVDEIIRVGKEELTRECNYKIEAENQKRFAELVESSGLSDGFQVPKVYTELSTERVLTTELVSGVPVDKITALPQEIRDSVSRRILVLTMNELFNWRFMQTDPNWSNFMYNAATDKLALIDFGAARDYDKSFVDDYMRVVWASSNKDADTMMKYSLKLGFLTGDESRTIYDAHKDAGMVVGEPFSSNDKFDFQASKLTVRLAEHTAIFMQGRLTPPPQEAYSLHRKLAGAFLICIKLQARIPCRDVLQDVYKKYNFDAQEQED